MLTTQPLDVLPIWGVYLFTVIVLLLSAEAGFRLGKLIQQRRPDQSESGVGTMVGASLAMLGFLLAFITSIAVNIFTARIQLVVKEANAIGTAYLRAGYLEEPISSESRDLLREYIDVRLAAIEPGQLDASLARTDEIHRELWQRAETVARENPVPTVSIYISALNDVIDIHTERVNASLTIRVPPILVLGLYLVAALTMVLIGIHWSYKEKRNYLALVTMVLILALVFWLTVEMDRSQEGLIRVPHQAMLDLRNFIDAGQ